MRVHTAIVGGGMMGTSRASVARRLPVYRERADLDQFAGWYTLTPDDRPLIGSVPRIAGLWIVAGFNGQGFKLAPSIGEGVARLLCGDEAGYFDRTSVALTRFLGRCALEDASSL